MLSDLPNALSVYDKQRIAIARQVIERKKQEMGDHVRAAACYGSVAHYASGEYSDVEMIVVTDDTILAKDELFFEQGIMVECNIRSSSRLLRAAQQQVTKRWGVEADQYRHHLVLLDIDGFFPRLWETSKNISESAFTAVLPETWWWCYEARNKLRNALHMKDSPRVCSDSWGFASAAAMHIALYERRPYESGRTLWQDVMTRGYGMKELVNILTTNSLEHILPVVNEVWKQVGQWGTPEGVDMQS